jgi:hypothetical protein
LFHGSKGYVQLALTINDILFFKGSFMLKSFTLLSALLLSPAVMAQDAPPPPPSGGTPQPEQIVAFMDANKDGFIYYIYATPAEMCQRPEGTYISEEEAVILEQRIAEAYAAEFGDDD